MEVRAMRENHSKILSLCAAVKSCNHDIKLLFAKGKYKSKKTNSAAPRAAHLLLGCM